MCRRGADCLIVATKALKCGWSERVGSSPLGPVNRPGTNLTFNGKPQLLCDGTIRISREAYVRIRERLGVKRPGSTLQKHD